MGLLTANPYENAWIILGLVVAAGIGLGVLIGIPTLLAMSGSAGLNVNSILCTGLLMLSALIPLGLFSSGLFTDFINQNYQYSTASVVGFFGILVTKLFGSTAFADISKAIVGFIPSIKTPEGEWSYLGLGSWFAIFAIVAGSVGASFGASGTQWGEGITIGLVVPFIMIFLAGNGLLGNFSQTPVAMSGGAGLQIDPYPSGYCDVPGFTWASNTIAPTSVILTQTIVWYNLIKDWDTGSSNHSILIGSVSTAVLALQWLALKMNGCLTAYKSGIYAPLIGYVVSIAVAGSAYGVIKNMPASMSITSGTTGTFVPSGTPGTLKPTVTPTGLKCPAGYNLTPSGDCVPTLGPGGSQIEIPIAVGGEQKTSEPVNDQDAFVCEAYKDGELVTSTFVD